MASFEAKGIKETVAQQLVTRLFRLFRGRRRIERRLVDGARFRLEDPNLTTGERAALQVVLSKNASRS